MKDRVQGCVVAGVALVGAGAMVASPVAQQAPEVLRGTAAKVQLAADVTYKQSVPELFALSAQRAATGFASAPVGFAAAALALAQGQDAGAQAILKEIVDGPQWAADPAIYALDDLLPEPIGGDEANNPRVPDDDSAISQFRADVLIAARDDINEALADALGVGTQPDVDDEGVVYAAARLGAGLGVSGVRAARSAVLAPLGLVAVAQGLQESFESGDNTALYAALETYIDGPNYVLDPVVFAVDDVVPSPIGSDPETNPAEMNGSDISRFRANVLLRPRDTIRAAVRDVLDVDSVTNDATAVALVGKNGTKSEGSATTTGTKKTDRPRPVRDTLTTINNEFTKTADRIDKTIKKFSGAEDAKDDKKADSED